MNSQFFALGVAGAPEKSDLTREQKADGEVLAMKVGAKNREEGVSYKRCWAWGEGGVNTP